MGFREVWLVDFEFGKPFGEVCAPVCLVAKEYRSGRRIRVWQDELLELDQPPYPTGPDSLFVAYYASAEVGCHLALGWPVPDRILDLFVEFRNQTNGLRTPLGKSLLGALSFYGLDAIEATEKERPAARAKGADAAIEGG